jgi:hypothetical protein
MISVWFISRICRASSDREILRLRSLAREIIRLPLHCVQGSLRSAQDDMSANVILSPDPIGTKDLIWHDAPNYARMER